MTGVPKILWRPPDDLVESCEMTRFARGLGRGFDWLVEFAAARLE